jgi:hypothetical protein
LAGRNRPPLALRGRARSAGQQEGSALELDPAEVGEFDARVSRSERVELQPLTLERRPVGLRVYQSSKTTRLWRCSREATKPRSVWRSSRVSQSIMATAMPSGSKSSAAPAVRVAPSQPPPDAPGAALAAKVPLGQLAAGGEVSGNPSLGGARLGEAGEGAEADEAGAVVAGPVEGPHGGAERGADVHPELGVAAGGHRAAERRHPAVARQRDGTT